MRYFFSRYKIENNNSNILKEKIENKMHKFKNCT